MTDRIRQLVKKITETRPVQHLRRQGLLSELRTLRSDLDANSPPNQAHSLDAAMLLLEFMNRSEAVATSETLQIVAGLVGTVEERSVRSTPVHAAPPPPPSPPQQLHHHHQQQHQQHQHQHQRPLAEDVAQHHDLRITQESLLGTILLQAGVISPESLSRALQLHASSRLALGQCLIQLGAASPEQIDSAIAYQDRMREDERGTRHEHPLHAVPPAQAQAPQRGDLRLSAKQKGIVQSMHSQVIGEVLIRLGTITREELERALQLQRAANIHIGAALVESGATTWDQLKKALDVQRQLRRAA